MWIPAPYDPTGNAIFTAQFIAENHVPTDWHQVAAKALGQEKAGRGRGFEPTPLRFGPNDPTCFWPHEGGIPFRGQEEAKRLIDLKIRALRPEERFKMLLSAEAGAGKTSLAWIIAKRLIERRGGRFFELLSTQIARLEDFLRLIQSLQPRDVIFLDEIQTIPETIGVEPLLHVLADTGEPRLKVGNGQILVPPSVSWIGATTDLGRMDRTTGGALRRRFDPLVRLEAPGVDTLVAILRDQDIPIDRDAAYDLAERSNGLPWMVLSLYKDCISLARVEGAREISMHHAQQVFQMRQLDQNGLDAADRAVLRALLRSPVPLANGTVKYRMSQTGVCAAAGVDELTYRIQIQPKLLRRGLLHTSGGQVLTERAITEYAWLLKGE